MRKFLSVLISPPAWLQVFMCSVLIAVAGVAYAQVPVDSLVEGKFTYREALLLEVSIVSLLSCAIVALFGILCRVGFMILKYRLDEADKLIRKQGHKIENIGALQVTQAEEWARTDAQVEGILAIIHGNGVVLRTQTN